VIPLACDLVVATRDPCTLGLNEGRRRKSRFPPAALGAVRARLSPPVFNNLCLTGRTFEPAEALELDVVDELCDAEALVPHACRAGRPAGRIRRLRTRQGNRCAAPSLARWPRWWSATRCSSTGCTEGRQTEAAGPLRPITERRRRRPGVFDVGRRWRRCRPGPPSSTVTRPISKLPRMPATTRPRRHHVVRGHQPAGGALSGAGPTAQGTTNPIGRVNAPGGPGRRRSAAEGAGAGARRRRRAVAVVGQLGWENSPSRRPVYGP